MKCDKNGCCENADIKIRWKHNFLDKGDWKYYCGKHLLEKMDSLLGITTGFRVMISTKYEMVMM